MKANITSAVALLFTILLGGISNAAIPGGASERKMQADSPEQVTIEITEAAKKSVQKGDRHEFEIIATGKVLAVTKSAAGLKEGDVVKLRYSIPDEEKSPSFGRWAAAVEKGVRYRAFLKADGAKAGGYAPSASGGSFVKAEEG